MLRHTLVLTFLVSAAAPAADFPEEALPSYIRKVRDYGERVDFSPDAGRVIYVTEPMGEVEELDLASGEVRTITTFDRPENVGFFRCYYLASGDYLLTGGPSRRECLFWYVPADDLSKGHMIPEPCWEGFALSRKSNKLAWTPNHHHLFAGELVVKDGRASIADKRLLFSTSDSYPLVPEYADRRMDPARSIKTYIEPQNFVPPAERLLTYSHYAGGPFTAEVMTYDMETGEMRRETVLPDQHGEPEGVFPEGNFTAVESGFGNDPELDEGSEIQRLLLDGSGRMDRLTFFGRQGNFKATNPVISDDGKWMAFQHGVLGDSVAGKGYGLYVMDLEKAYEALGIEP